MSIGGGSPRVVWIDFRYENLPRLCYHCGLITHETKVCLSGNGFNSMWDLGVNIQGLRIECTDLILCTPKQAKGIISPFGSVDGDPGANHSSDARGGSDFVTLRAVKSTTGCGNGTTIELGLTMAQTRKTNPRMARKEKDPLWAVVN